MTEGGRAATMCTMDKFDGVRDLLPADATAVLGSIRIVSYLDENAELQWKWKIDGDMPLVQTLGLLTLVARSYAEDAEIE